MHIRSWELGVKEIIENLFYDFSLQPEWEKEQQIIMKIDWKIIW